MPLNAGCGGASVTLDTSGVTQVSSVTFWFYCDLCLVEYRRSGDETATEAKRAAAALDL
jgi:hypothetical protein